MSTQPITPNPSSSDMIFDAVPVSIATPASPAPQPQSSSSAIADLTFDPHPVTQATTVPGTQQPAGQAFTPTNQLRAIPDDGMAAKLQNWASNVSGDVKYGTSVTGVGHVLKALGAHGVYSGEPEAVGDFMASLPLGLLKSTRGAAELTQPGQRWQGVKDGVGGLLDASTIPGGFVAPEAGELAGQGVAGAADAVTNAAKTVAGSFDKASIQPGLHAGIRQVLGKVAEDAGVAPEHADSIRDVAANLSTAVRAKASGIYQQLDAATGGRFQRFSDSLSNLEKAINESLGIDPDREADLLKKKGEVEAAQKTALDQARASGVDPTLIDKATASWKQQAALSDVSKVLQSSVSGQRPSIAAGAKATPETVNVKQAFQRLNRLNDKGRLAQAIGPENAATLLRHVDSALLESERIANRNKYIGTAVKTLGLGAAASGAVHFAHEWLGN